MQKQNKTRYCLWLYTKHEKILYLDQISANKTPAARQSGYSTMETEVNDYLLFTRTFIIEDIYIYYKYQFFLKLCQQIENM